MPYVPQTTHVMIGTWVERRPCLNAPKPTKAPWAYNLVYFDEKVIEKLDLKVAPLTGILYYYDFQSQIGMKMNE